MKFCRNFADNLENVEHFRNFLANIPEFWKTSDRTRIWKVRMVRSLADRTFQLRNRPTEARPVRSPPLCNTVQKLCLDTVHKFHQLQRLPPMLALAFCIAIYFSLKSQSPESSKIELPMTWSRLYNIEKFNRDSLNNMFQDLRNRSGACSTNYRTLSL